MRWTITILQIDDQSHCFSDPAVRRLLELALTVKNAANLPRCFLCGDRTVTETEQSHERMVSLQT